MAPFCPHLTFGAIPLFMRVWRQPKIRALNFKICALYFKIQGTYFFFAPRGGKKHNPLFNISRATGYGLRSPLPRIKKSQVMQDSFIEVSR